MMPLSLNEVNQLARSIYHDSIKDPALRLREVSGVVEYYKIVYKPDKAFIGGRQDLTGYVAFDKKKGIAFKFDPQGRAAPVIMFRSNHTTFLRWLERQKMKGADVYRIK